MATTEIAQKLRTAFSTWSPFDEARAEAQALTDGEREKSQGQREQIMLGLAELSAFESWEPGEVKTAAKQVLAAQNKKSPTLAVFMSEAVAVALPHARERAAELLEVIRTAFDREKDMGGRDAKPCRKAFSRVYKAWITLCRAAGDNETVPHDVAEFIAYAKANDPDLDYHKVAKRLDRIKAELAGFANDFPVPGFGAIERYLSDIDEKALRNARAKKCASDEALTAARQAAHTLAPIPPAIAERAVQVYEPMEGASDIVSELAAA